MAKSTINTKLTVGKFHGIVQPNLDYHYVLSPSKLEGKVHTSGNKNSVLRLLAASLLTNGRIHLNNCPVSLVDLQIHLEMLRVLGKVCQIQADQIWITEPKTIGSQLDWQGQSIRGTLLILGALVARTGYGAVPLPGGCDLGERKFDLHEMLLKQMGAEVWVENGMLHAHASGRLKGTDIYLPIRSTGATENGIICGSLASGTTRIWNPHVRPEILDLVGYLRKMGAEIKVFGQQHIEITGVEALKGVQHTVIPDNVEAITWLIGSVITGGDIEIVDFPFEHLEIPLTYLRESGAKFYKGTDSLIVRGGCPYPVDISTGPYPGINSDMQPLFALYGACANGESRIVDLRFPGRYAYAKEMLKLGVELDVAENLLRIMGGHRLKGAQVHAPDLRAGIALALAGTVADGETVIGNAWQIERGYDRFVNKLQGLGANIRAYEDWPSNQSVNRLRIADCGYPSGMPEALRIAD